MATKSDLMEEAHGIRRAGAFDLDRSSAAQSPDGAEGRREGGQDPDSRGEMAQLKKASAKKVTLMAFLTDRDIQIPEHATISRLFNLGEGKKITLRYLPNSTDLVGFGKYGNMTYRQLKEAHPAYTVGG